MTVKSCIADVPMCFALVARVLSFVPIHFIECPEATHRVRSGWDDLVLVYCETVFSVTYTSSTFLYAIVLIRLRWFPHLFPRFFP